MLGDAEHPISFRFQPVERGDGPHILVVVWAGHRESGRGKCGTITLRREEWTVMRALLTTVTTDRLVYNMSGDYEVEGVIVDPVPMVVSDAAQEIVDGPGSMRCRVCGWDEDEDVEGEP